MTAFALAALLVGGGTLAATRQKGPADVVRPGPATSPHSEDEPTPSVSGHSPAPSTSQHSSTESGARTPQACESSDLAVSMGTQMGADGNRYNIFVFRNTGSSTCRMSGYPKVTGVNAKGVVTTTAADELNGWAADHFSSVPTVDLLPGGYASAGVDWSVPVSGLCSVVTDFEVAPPSGGHPARIHMVDAEHAGGADGPGCSRFSIHPVVGGVNSWYFPGPNTYPSGASEPTATISY
jgi:hypothetical protein